MAFYAAFENGPAARSFAADAYDCIMVRILADLPNTRLRRVETAPEKASSPWVISRTPIAGSVSPCSRPSRTSLRRRWRSAVL